MDERWRKTFLAHSAEQDYYWRTTEAIKLISKALHSSSRPLVAYSGGKDSTVMLHLALSICPDITVFHWDYGPRFMPRPLETRILEIAREIGAKDIRVATSPKYLDPNHKGAVFGVDYFKVEAPRLIRDGYDMAMVGLRSEESCKRKRRIREGRSLTRIKEIWPVHSWTWLDIWSYIVKNKVPYLSEFYDPRNKIMGYEHTRLCTLFDPQFAPMGSVNLDGFFDWRHRHGETP